MSINASLWEELLEMSNYLINNFYGTLTIENNDEDNKKDK